MPQTKVPNPTLAADNTAAVGMLYGRPENQPPGPANADTEADSIKWATRFLLFKQYNVESVFTNIDVRGQGPTHTALRPPTLFSLERTLDRYGPGAERGRYGAGIIQIKDEGRRTISTGTQFVWPVLTDRRARHQP